MRTMTAKAGTVLMAVLLAFGAAAPVAAQPPGQVPSYARPAPRGAETIHGTIASVIDAYHITVNDDRGFLDNVTLQRGTVIEPRGLRLEPGMVVTISGTNAGSSFVAMDIEAPGEFAAAQSYAADAYGAYPDYGYYWPSALLDAGTSIIVQPAPGGSGGTPPVPSHQRGIEPPNPKMPMRRPLDGPDARAAASQPNNPPAARTYNAPQNDAPRYNAPVPQYRAPAVESRPAPAAAAPARTESRAPESHASSGKH